MNLKDLDIISIKKDLKNRFSQKRYKHTEGVIKIASELASKNNINVKKAEIAALLHDYAKPLSEKELKNIVEKSHWEIDSIELKLPEVLHAPAGAFLVKSKYDIIDLDILEAIRFHTIGTPKMGKIALIIFAADFIEPNRNYPGVNRLRDIAINRSLSELIVAVCDQTIKYNIAKDRIIHPNTLLLRNKYIGG